jgi:DNA-directed RNA polymerase specialized sigma24 family protein
MSDSFQQHETTSLTALSVRMLCLQCTQETTSRSEYSPHCYELFRRAIVEHNNEAWEAIVQQYGALVRHWLLQHPLSHQLAEHDIEDLTFQPFTKFWRFYSAENLANAKTIASILAYLKSCVDTCLRDRLRTQKRRDHALLNEDIDTLTHPPATPSAQEQVLSDLGSEQIWQIVQNNCNDERDLVIARLSFVLNWKANDIYQEHRQLFNAVDEVYTLKRNLLTRLSRNPQLRQWRDQ